MTRLRPGAVPSIGQEEAEPVVDVFEAADRARAAAAAYESWINSGKTRETLEAEGRQRHQRRAAARPVHDEDG